MSAATIHKEDFSDPKFNAKKWINSILTTKQSNTSDNAKAADEDEDGTNMTMLATRLQLMGESTSQDFDRLSSHVIKSMPHIIYDLKTLSENAKLTQEHIEKVKSNLGLVEDDTKTALERLARSHTVKTHMEECRAILLEKSNHLEKIREEEERKRQQEEAERRTEAEAAQAAQAAARALEEENERKRKIEAEKEEEERLREEEILRKQKEAEEKEEEERKAARAPSPDMDDESEYGHVQLPPLRQPPPRQHTFQQIQKQTNTLSDQNDSYLQQISGTVSPQVSSVFKKIGVPIDKLWQ